MAPAAGFSDVLRQFVDRAAAGDPTDARRWHPGIGTRPLFPFEMPGPPPQPVAPAPARCTVEAPPPRRPRQAPARTLTPAQRRALGHLVALGAAISPDFTREELRSAFRALARAFHPDRHPGIGPAEQARLSAAFAAMRAHYDVLTRAV